VSHDLSLDSEATAGIDVVESAGHGVFKNLPESQLIPHDVWDFHSLYCPGKVHFRRTLGGAYRDDRRHVNPAILIVREFVSHLPLDKRDLSMMPVEVMLYRSVDVQATTGPDH
jgi:hypothetical protein